MKETLLGLLLLFAAGVLAGFAAGSEMEKNKAPNYKCDCSTSKIVISPISLFRNGFEKSL